MGCFHPRDAQALFSLIRHHFASFPPWAVTLCSILCFTWVFSSASCVLRFIELLALISVCFEGNENGRLATFDDISHVKTTNDLPLTQCVSTCSTPVSVPSLVSGSVSHTPQHTLQAGLPSTPLSPVLLETSQETTSSGQCICSLSKIQDSRQLYYLIDEKLMTRFAVKNGAVLHVKLQLSFFFLSFCVPP